MKNVPIKMIELKAEPCPFCGNVPDHYISVITGISCNQINLRLICRTCDFEMSETVPSGSPWYRVEEANEKLFVRWNRRDCNV